MAVCETKNLKLINVICKDLKLYFKEIQSFCCRHDDCLKEHESCHGVLLLVSGGEEVGYIQCT